MGLNIDFRLFEPVRFGRLESFTTKYQIALANEEALLNDEDLIGLHFDYQKAFDLIPRNIIFHLAKIQGFDLTLLAVMENMYDRLQRYFKIPGDSSPFRSSCGNLQGCPLSVVFTNILTAIWAKAIYRMNPPLPLKPSLMIP